MRGRTWVFAILAATLPLLAVATESARLDSDFDGIADSEEVLAGLDPYNADTDQDGIGDYDDNPADIALSYGWLYTDNDYVADTFENLWEDIYASPFRYDEHEDRDFDGWNNWSESLVGTAFAYNCYNEVSGTNATGTAESSATDKAANFPLPTLQVTLDYDKAIQGAKLVIHAYSRQDMNGWPDAVFVKDFSSTTLDTWPMTIAIGGDELVYGHLRQGRNWFYAWMEEDGSTLPLPIHSSADGGINGAAWPTWTPSEPAAIADNQLDGIDIGFDLNEVTFHLTDKPESFARVSWQGSMPEGQDVHVAMFYWDDYVFNRIIKWPRTWVHEGDIISWNIERSGWTDHSRKDFGLCAQTGVVSANDHVPRPIKVVLTPQRDFEANWWSIAEFCWITNWMHTASALPVPTLYGPINMEVVSAARPEFRFSLDPEFTEFRFRLLKRSTESDTWDNPISLIDERVLAPGRFLNDATGRRDHVIWMSPIAIGDVSPNNFVFERGKTYQWSVTAYSPALKTGTTTVLGYFSTADSGNLSAPDGQGKIDVNVSYPSDMVYMRWNNATPYICVQAFRSKSFNGLPDASLRMSATGTCTLKGLEVGENYYIRAYIEQGGDSMSRDKWESWGYCRADNEAVNPFIPLAVTATPLGNTSAPANVVIRDCDTDNDLLPDSFEWSRCGNLTSFGIANYTPRVKQTVAYAGSPLVVAASESSPYFEWLYTDNDYVLDDYEQGWDDSFATSCRYDEHEDGDRDGWNNWCEALSGTTLAYNSYNENADTNEMGAAEATMTDKSANFPMPALQIMLDYCGRAIRGAKLVIHAYSREDMNGWPDAVFVKDFSADMLDTWPMTITVGRESLVYGHLRQGRNWFYAWMEEDGSALASVNDGNWPTWTSGEPAAIADNQLDGIDIGFDRNEISFHFTDKPESFARVSWQDQMPEGDVHVAMLYSGNAVFSRIIKWPRTWMHEGDIVSWNNGLNGDNRRNFGLGALESAVTPDNEVVRMFNVFLTPQCDYEANGLPDDYSNRSSFCEIVNWMHSASALPKPVLYGPVCKEIVADARPEFKFSLDPEFTEFQFVFKRVNLASGESVAIFNQRVLAPGRFWNDATGRRDLVIWRFPHSVGGRIVNGPNSYLFADGPGFEYKWTVVPFSPAIRTSQTALSPSEGVFLTAAANAAAGAVNVSGGKGAITVNVTYPSGMATLDPTTTYMSAPFICVQAFRSGSFNGLSDASIQAKAVGTYTLSGLEDGESYYLRAYIEQGGNPTMRDNWESWGYYRAGDGAANPFEPVAVKATRFGNASAPYEIVIQDCDTDNDLFPDAYEWAVSGDLASLGVANDALTVRTDSDGDGIADGLEDALGFDQDSTQTLRITSLSFDSAGNLVLGWTWDGVERTRGPNTLNAEVPYTVQAKVKLSDTKWTNILTLSTDNLDGQAVISEEGQDISAYRFFRVKLGTK